jgi:hypothetical protein
MPAMMSIRDNNFTTAFEKFAMNKPGDNLTEKLWLSTELGILKSYAHWRDTRSTWLSTAFKTMQVLDKKRENRAVHKKVAPLSTTTSFN